MAVGTGVLAISLRGGERPGPAKQYIELSGDFEIRFRARKCPRRSCAEGDILRISGALLRAGIAHHLNVGGLEMSVLIVTLFYPRIVGHVFRIFFQVVRGCV